QQAIESLFMTASCARAVVGARRASRIVPTARIFPTWSVPAQPHVQAGKTLSRANRSNACRADRRPKASKPKDLLAVIEVRQKRLGRAFVEHRTALERENTVRQREDEVEIMLDDDDRRIRAQAVEDAEQLLDHRWGEALERFVEEQKAHVT